MKRILCGILIAAVTAAATVLLSSYFSTAETLNRIVNQDGYRITVQVEKPVDITIEKALLPDDFPADADVEVSFDENQIVLHQTETTTLYLEQICGWQDNDFLFFAFDFSYKLPQSGVILLPYRMNLDEDGNTESVTNSLRTDCVELRDATRSFPGAVAPRGFGPSQKFTVHVDREAFASAEEFLSFRLDGFTELTYEQR